MFDESTRCVAFGGKLLVIGFVAGRIPEIAVNIPLIKGFSIVGVRAGEYARRFPDRGARIAAEVSRLANDRAIAPVIDRELPLATDAEKDQLIEEKGRLRRQIEDLGGVGMRFGKSRR